MRGALGRARVRAKGLCRFNLCGNRREGRALVLQKRAGEVGLEVWGELHCRGGSEVWLGPAGDQ